MDEVLTVKKVASTMQAVLGGRLSRREARRIVEPWVEGDADRFEHGALSGATVIHGIDVVRDRQSGRVWHAGEGQVDGFVMSDDDVREAFIDWARRFAVTSEWIDDAL